MIVEALYLGLVIIFPAEEILSFLFLSLFKVLHRGLVLIAETICYTHIRR